MHCYGNALPPLTSNPAFSYPKELSKRNNPQIKTNSHKTGSMGARQELTDAPNAVLLPSLM